MFHKRMHLLSMIGFAAIGEEVLMGDGGIGVLDPDSGIIREVLQTNELVPDSVFSSSLEHHLDEAEADQRYIEGVVAEQPALVTRLQTLEDEIRSDRQEIAEDVDEMVGINAQLKANQTEIQDAEADRDRHRAIAGGELDALDTTDGD